MNVFQGMIDAYASPRERFTRKRAARTSRGTSLDYEVLMQLKNSSVPLSMRQIAKALSEDQTRIQHAITRLCRDGEVSSCDRIIDERIVSVLRTAYCAVEIKKLSPQWLGSKAGRIYAFLRAHGGAASPVISARLGISVIDVHNALHYYRKTHFCKADKKVPVVMTKNVSACLYRIKE